MILTSVMDLFLAFMLALIGTFALILLLTKDFISLFYLTSFSIIRSLAGLLKSSTDTECLLGLRCLPYR